MAKILVIRFSAIGDVAMTIPVIYSLAVQYPQHQITVLSRHTLAPLFNGLPTNISFRGVDLKGEYTGIMGLERMYKDLKKEHFDAVADLHDVLRSKYLRWRFKLDGVKVAHLDKGRCGKKKLVRTENKVMEQQKSSFQRYAETFRGIGYPVQLSFQSIFGNSKGDISCMHLLTGGKGTDKWIGIAPFAAHAGKIYPLSKQEEVVRLLSARQNTKILLFGGGAKEVEVLAKWEQQYPNVISTAGKLAMNTELALMSHLDVMLSMDSANMHLASLVNIPVVSIWGATHPYAGFMGWKQLPDNALQIDLPCRPCSIFGNKPCLRKDYACLQGITPEMVVHRLEYVVNLKKE